MRRPELTPEIAEVIARELYGVVGVASDLGSNQDRNFKIVTPDGLAYVLRVDNPTLLGDDKWAALVHEAQHEAMRACSAAGLRVPKIFAGTNGALVQEYGRLKVRLFEFLKLQQMVDHGYFAAPVMASFGEISARTVLALAGLQHADGDPLKGLEREHPWDMRASHREITAMLPAIADETLRARIASVADEAHAALGDLQSHLPVQAIHGDLTDDNVMGQRRPDSRLYPTAVIDFGDVGYGWRIAELAVTVSSLLQHADGDPLKSLEAVREFAAVMRGAGSPVTLAEAKAIWPLVNLRAALLVASGHRQLELDDSNDYARDRIAGEQEIFDVGTKYQLFEMTEHVLATLGMRELLAVPNEAKTQPLASVLSGFSGPVEVIDVGVESANLDGGAWLEADIEERLVAQAFAGGAAAAVFGYGRYRLTRSIVDHLAAPKTFQLTTEVWLPSAQPAAKSVQLIAPAAGTVISTAVTNNTVTNNTVTALTINLRDTPEWNLVIHCDSGLETDGPLEEGTKVPAGTPLARLSGAAEGDFVRMSFGVIRNLIEPSQTIEQYRFVEPNRAPAWRRLTADPAHLLGLEPAQQRDESSDELVRREKIFAKAQERYYERPMQVERGWRHWLVDTTGRTYIDMVNNVTALGHGHPRVADAINRQTRLLGTNSRFLYRALAEYSERLLELLPADSGLDTVLLVNSGSEAVDLALRLAQAATGRKTVVALREAYHGWTMASDAVTTSAFDNPYALATRPDWVHVADVPNTYRGTHRGPEAGAAYLRDFERDLVKLAAEGREIAGFICESVLGNAGGVLLPDGYLAGVYDAVREAGGLVIADEVQVGFGRMGSTFWGFELSGVRPDIITIAKPMGNGFPIGGVITSKWIADALATQGQFFSSAGGNPVSCAAGLAVLDVMRDENLQENAAEVGAYLRDGFERLALKHELIGFVHGEGLYLGVELVRDSVTLEPATEEAAAICERLKELGVIMLTTSERSNVLKVKPPLCLTRASADIVLEALDHTLTYGW